MRPTVMFLITVILLFVQLMTPVRSANASADSGQSLYANALLSDGATYAFDNAYQWRGQVGGQVWLGDGVVNLLMGTPTALTFGTGTSHVTGPGVYNGMSATFREDVSNSAIAWEVDIAGVPVWTGNSGYVWAGVILQP